jgi:MFS family permease
MLPWLVAVAFFMESLDTTILNTAVPVIAKALTVTPLSMKSVLASYTLSLAVFIPISGWMADRFGTRRVFASAVGLFTLGSFLCGLSSNIHLLVACRPPRSVPCTRRFHNPVSHRLQQAKGRRWRRRNQAKRYSPGIA